MKPPTAGPRAGPANGPIVNRDIAHPLVTGSQMSPLIAPARTRGEAPKAPERNRKMRIEAVFFERAHPTENPV